MLFRPPCGHGKTKIIKAVISLFLLICHFPPAYINRKLVKLWELWNIESYSSLPDLLTIFLTVGMHELFLILMEFSVVVPVPI